MFKSLKWLFVSMLTLSLLVVGCSSNSSSDTAASKKDSGSNKEKILQLWTREASAPNVKEAVDKFNSENRGFKVELTSFPNANFTEQFSTALASGAAPDIISIDLVYAPYFASIGAFQDLTDYYNSLDFKEHLIQAMATQGAYNGKQYALPFSGEVSALAYNKEHFKEAGLDPDSPPETWEDLREYARKLTTTDRFAYVYAGADVGGQAFTFLPYIWGNGGDILNENGTEAKINSPETIEALQFYTDLTQKDKVTPEGVTNYSWAQAQDAFTSGKASMFVTGNFIVNVFDTDYPDIDYGIALIPRNEGKNHASFAGGDLIAIPTESKHSEEALEFLQYALSEEVQVETFAKNGAIPVREDLLDNKYFKNSPHYQVFAESLKLGHTPYSLKYNEIFSQPVLGFMQLSLNGELSPQEAFKNAEKNIIEILSR
ncbi:ABC transporter substrate-binding protein [Paenibacillus fonticola]|uniref:ABC transporter substrate-binding protein n=1 Tax=Paenibacillus fonticola TaxID=379896 RepID=UPI000371ED54|nr:ABC transporter substrate-binding protein [Paenibacillus fonticola]